MSIHDHYRREQDRKARQANDRRHKHAFGRDVGGQSWASSPIDQDTPGGGAARAETSDPSGAVGLSSGTREAHMSFTAGAQTVSGAVAWTPVTGGLTRPRLFETAIVMPLTGPASISGELGWDGWTGCTSVTVAQVRDGTDVDTLTLSVPSWDGVRSTVVVIPHTGLEFELEAGDTVQVRVAGGQSLAGGVLTVTQLEQPPIVEVAPEPDPGYLVVTEGAFTSPWQFGLASWDGQGTPTEIVALLPDESAWIDKANDGLWIAAEDGVVHKIDLSGSILAGPLTTGVDATFGLAFDGTNLYLMQYGTPYAVGTVWRVDPSDGSAVELAGSIDATDSDLNGLAWDGSSLRTTRRYYTGAANRTDVVTINPTTGSESGSVETDLGTVEVYGLTVRGGNTAMFDFDAFAMVTVDGSGTTVSSSAVWDGTETPTGAVA